MSTQTTSFSQDVSNRPRRYLKDFKICSPLYFGLGNTAFAAATGVVGGFTLGAMPAVVIQGSVTSLLAYQQARATYKGENYNAPMKTLAISNWAAAGAMIVGAVSMGTPLAIAMASFPATMFLVWGFGHWNLNKFVSKIEKIQKECHERGLSEEEIKERIDNDKEVSKLLKKFQIQYGIADMTAIISAAAKGENVRELSTNFANIISSWESIIPLSIFALGLTRAFSEKTGNIIDQYTPKFVKPLFKTANSSYKTGYATTGVIIAAKALMDNSNEVNSIIETIKETLTDEEMVKIIAYVSWAHAYAALDARIDRPISADEYQKWHTAFQDKKAMFSLFDKAVQNVENEEKIERYNKLNKKMVDLYEAIPEDFSVAKDQLFGFLEMLAASSPSGANEVRSCIMRWAEEGDKRSVLKMQRLRSIDIQSGIRALGSLPPARSKASQSAIDFAKGVLHSNGEVDEAVVKNTAAPLRTKSFTFYGGQ